MKYFLIALFCFPTYLIAQSDWALPTNAGGAYYCRCFSYKPDSIAQNQPLYAVYNLTYDSVHFKVQEKHVWKKLINMPVFDTILLHIPVDKETRMAHIPNQYDVIRKYTRPTNYFYKWIEVTSMRKKWMMVDCNRCIIWAKVEIPNEYNFLPTLTLKSMAYELRIDTADSVVIQQVVERSPILFKEEETPEQYETLLIPKGPNIVWHDWMQFYEDGKVIKPVIADIQKALKRLHYYRGKITNEIDERTKKALIKFQKDKGLEIGNLNKETFDLLGVKPY
jgi:Putative peptidoglycan binding domain